ncbi:MAG: NfeD family protein [Cyanobacteriota bacterium]|nr:NfeD family protein [Cyanobacteriota bacterium]
MLVFWLVLGLGLVAAELFLPGLVAGSIGLAALIAAGLAFWGVPTLLQFLTWIVLSTGFTFLTRRLVPRESPHLEESRDARALNGIPAGQIGRVAYLGSTWNAKCGIPQVEIDPQQELYVLERKGNTLIVIPSKLLNS